MKIIAFTGMPFAGKSEAVKVGKEMGIPVIRMGDMVWEEVKRRGLDINDENVGKIADEMRRSYGMDIWAKRTIDKILKMKNVNKIIIDGIRNFEEIDFFKKMLGNNFILISILASDEKRYQRAMKRGREDDSKDIELIKERDQREKSWGIENVIASADVVVPNEGSLEDFQRKIREILIKI